ncbi:ATP-binding protein [Saccharopolyspora sp. NPDC002376]
MNDPTIVTLEQLGVDIDPHWAREAREKAALLESAIPARYAGAVVSHPAIAGWVRALVQAAADTQASPGGPVGLSAGRSLMLLGETGTGKTHAAFGALRAFGASGVTMSSWQFVAAADLYAQMRPRHGVDSESVFETYAHASLLVVDDLGAAKNSEWTEEINYRLINHRYDRMLPTIITSNLGLEELRGRLGDRVASRLNEMADRGILDGGDRRRGGGQR